MIIVRILGGFGNQLFAYACGYALARDMNEKLVLDISSYDNGYFRPLRLDELATEDYEVISIRYKQNRLSGFMHRMKLRFKYNYIRESVYYKYQPLKPKAGKDTYIDGYWQSEKYFARHAPEIMRQFISKKPLSGILNKFKSSVESSPSISVHIRRGDYIKLGNCLDVEYYNRAIKIISEKIPSAEFYFFSDDMEWVKQNFSNDRHFHFVSDLYNFNDLEDFFAMSCCKHNIIANSSFSWWSAYLNPNNEKIVICPEDNEFYYDFYPDSWTRLKV